MIAGKKYTIESPKHCPNCRKQRRLSFRNERNLFRRSCNLTQKPFIALYPQDSKYTVYNSAAWWSDAWDALDYGRDFDFNEPFFEQFRELMEKVPHLGMINSYNENSDYCAHSIYYKDSYICVSGVECENCYYTYFANHSKDCMDCAIIFRGERCYECINCENVSFSIFAQECRNSHDLIACADMAGCANCIGCAGLRNKNYYLFNEEVSKKDFEEYKKNLHENWEKEFPIVKEKFEKLRAQTPCKALQLVNTENAIGDHLQNCKNAYDAFYCENLEDAAYCWNIPKKGKDIIDMNYSPSCETSAEGVSALNAQNTFATITCWDVSDVFYSILCFNSKNLFGCFGLRNKNYCILNKQYTQEEYEKLVPQIIEHMGGIGRAHGASAEPVGGQWSQFFPSELSFFPYDQSVAQEYFPKEMTPEKIEKSQSSTSETPDIHTCKTCSKKYKIIAQEKNFYKEMKIPTPEICPECRHKQRQERKASNFLWNRKCDKCLTETKTSWPPNKAQKIYCEKCYLAEMY